MLICPNKSSQAFKNLVIELGSESLAYFEWHKREAGIPKSINVQRSNLQSIENGDKVISIREPGKHNYKAGDTLDIAIKGDKTGIKVLVDSITTINDFTKLSDDKKDDFARAIGNYKDYADLVKSDDYAREDSELSFKFPSVYRFLQGKIAQDVIKYTKIQEEFLEGVTFINPVTKESIEPENEKLRKQFRDKYKVQFVYFRRRLDRLKQDLQGKDPLSEQYDRIKSDIDKITTALEELKNKQSKEPFIVLGTELLNNVESFLNDLKSGKTTLKIKDLNYTREVLDVFSSFIGLSDRAKELYEELLPFIDDFTSEQVNQYSTEGDEKTLEEIKAQNQDISRLKKGVGALADVSDYLGRTIAAIIKAAQNRVSTKNKQLTKQVQEEVDALKKWSSSQGIKDSKIYEPFIQELYGTTVLTREYVSEFYIERTKAFKKKFSNDPELVKEGNAWLKENTRWNEDNVVVASKDKWYNPNYKKIQNTPELKRFYDFHRKLTLEAKQKLPVEIGSDFIANIKSSITNDILNGNKGVIAGLKEGFSNIVTTKEFTQGQFVGDEDLAADVVPMKYIYKIKAGEKSRDLGENLLKFVTFANSYEEMSEVLPQARLLQEEIKKKDYIKSSSPDKKVVGEESNIYKMVDIVIKQQIKGETKLEEGKIKLKDTYDENGKPIERYILTSDIVDFALKYNSLLRIGLNPINAFSNVFIGDIGNIIESFGSRFYTTRNLISASNIFAVQNFKEDSVLNRLLEELNPLQELEDYENVDKVRLKGKLSAEGVKNIMYKPQQMGEKWLQSRTMLAIMIKDGLMTNGGELTPLYEKLTEDQKAKLSDKIQRVNQMIHGRYSSRDAATLQQNALYRMVSQFRKWIPAALEARLGDKYYDNRLQAELEGRYRTAFRLMFTDLKDTITRLQSGKLSDLEIYNMKKNITEVVLIVGSILAYYGLKGDDDDKEWRKKPGVKFALDQLNRISGDLIFFYNPSEYNRLASNAIPLSKTLNDLLNVMRYTPYLLQDAGKEEVYQSGFRKGEYKFWSKFGSLIPGYKPSSEVIRYWNGVDFVEAK